MLNFDDFESYSAAVLRAIAGESLYSARQLAEPYFLQEVAGGRGFIYPPTAALLLLPTALGNLFGLVLLVVSLGVLCYVVAELVRHELPHSGISGIAVGALMLLSPAATDAIYVGQLTPLLAAGYGASWLAPRSTGWVAVLGGFVKVFPAVLLAWAFRERQSVLKPAIAAAVIALTVSVWLGFNSWTEFMRVWSNARPQCDPPSLGSAWCAFGEAGRYGGAFVAFALMGLSIKFHSRDVAFAALGAASVVAAPDIFPNYLLIPAVALIPVSCRLARAVTTRLTRSAEISW